MIQDKKWQTRKTTISKETGCIETNWFLKYSRNNITELLKPGSCLSLEISTTTKLWTFFYCCLLNYKFIFIRALNFRMFQMLSLHLVGKQIDRTYLLLCHELVSQFPLWATPTWGSYVYWFLDQLKNEVRRICEKNKLAKHSRSSLFAWNVILGPSDPEGTAMKLLFVSQYFLSKLNSCLHCPNKISKNTIIFVSSIGIIFPSVFAWGTFLLVLSTPWKWENKANYILWHWITVVESYNTQEVTLFGFTVLSQGHHISQYSLDFFSPLAHFLALFLEFSGPEWTQKQKNEYVKA